MKSARMPSRFEEREADANGFTFSGRWFLNFLEVQGRSMRSVVEREIAN